MFDFCLCLFSCRWRCLVTKQLWLTDHLFQTVIYLWVRGRWYKTFFSLSAPFPSCKLSCICYVNGFFCSSSSSCVFMAMSASNKMHEWMNICHILISLYQLDEHKPAWLELRMSLSACCYLYIWPCAVCDSEAAQMSLCGFATRIYSSDG